MNNSWSKRVVILFRDILENFFKRIYYFLYGLLPQNLKSIVLVELDDSRAFGLAEAVVVELHHIIDRVFDFVADVVVNHR
jgi:hypothetical protein